MQSVFQEEIPMTEHNVRGVVESLRMARLLIMDDLEQLKNFAMGKSKETALDF